MRLGMVTVGLHAGPRADGGSGSSACAQPAPAMPMAAAASTSAITAAAAPEAPAGASLREAGAAAGALSPSVAGLEAATAELQAAPHVYMWSARRAAKAVKERLSFLVRLLATTCHDAGATVVDRFGVW